jgi:hypothetical protein
MQIPRFKQRVTVTFEMQSKIDSYPKGTSHEAAAHIDTLNLTGDTEFLFDILCDLPYSVIVVPVAD